MAAGVVLGGCVLMPVIQVGIIMIKTRLIIIKIKMIFIRIKMIIIRIKMIIIKIKMLIQYDIRSNGSQGVWCGLAWVRDTVKEKFCS